MLCFGGVADIVESLHSEAKGLTIWMDKMTKTNEKAGKQTKVDLKIRLG